MKDFGTLEYVLDIYSKNWTWKLTGPRAVSMVARVIPHAWYGDGPEEAIVPDTIQNVAVSYTHLTLPTIYSV